MSRRDASQPGRLPGTWVLLRDILSFLGGWALIFVEITQFGARIPVLMFGGAVLGIPGLAVGFKALALALSQSQGGTRVEPYSPQPEVPSEQ